MLTYDDYRKRRSMWDRVRQCIGIDGDFYEGAEDLLYPPEWLNAAERCAAEMQWDRRAKVIGVDSAAGGDNTCWVIAGYLGLLDIVSKKTPDTSVVTSETIALMHKWSIDPKNVLFDSGGGGQQHADRLRTQGFAVRTVGFGEAASSELKRGRALFGIRKIEKEERYIYKNRRAQMYGILSELLRPDELQDGTLRGKFGLPYSIANRPRADGGPSLRQQLAPIPRWYDGEGRLFLPPKQRKPDTKDRGEVVTMNSLIGCSPDEADALVLAAYGLVHKTFKAVAGVL